jgi:uncharacterized protein
MAIWQLAVQFILGGAVGFSMPLTGSGGSALAVPLLVYISGAKPHEAVCVSMTAVGSTALIGTIVRSRSGENPGQLGIASILALPAIVGGPAGAWLATQVSGQSLLLLFASLMAIVGCKMLYTSGSGRRQRATESPSSPARNAAAATNVDVDSGGRTLGVATAGFCAGLLSGLLGVGGGIVLVPYLTHRVRLTSQSAVATSVAVTALTAAVSTTAHLMFGQKLLWEIAAIFTGGALVGWRLGSSIAKHVAEERIQQIFGATMIAMAASMLVRMLLVG